MVGLACSANCACVCVSGGQGQDSQGTQKTLPAALLRHAARGQSEGKEISESDWPPQRRFLFSAPVPGTASPFFLKSSLFVCLFVCAPGSTVPTPTQTPELQFMFQMDLAGMKVFKDKLELFLTNQSDDFQAQVGRVVSTNTKRWFPSHTYFSHRMLSYWSTTR